jgi:putative transposase
MAYLPRYFIVCDGCSFHVTWQCHNKDWLLQWNWAKRLYYDLLLKYKDRYRIQIHSYHFMENHPHLTGTMQSMELFSNFFRVVNNLLARKINKQLTRRGQVVMDRFKSPRIQDDAHMIKAMTYGDLNGVRAGRDKSPEESKWSSYAYYAYGKDDPLVTPAPSYLALGATEEERQRVYRAMTQELMLQARINISNTSFIGDPDWVKRQYQELQEQMKSIRANKLMLQKSNFGTAPPN